MTKSQLIRDLCSVEFRTKGKITELINEFEAEKDEERIVLLALRASNYEQKIVMLKAKHKGAMKHLEKHFTQRLDMQKINYDIK